MGKMGSEIISYILEMLRRVSLEDDDKPLYVDSTSMYAFVTAAMLVNGDATNVLTENLWTSQADVNSTLRRYIDDCQKYGSKSESYNAVTPTQILQNLSKNSTPSTGLTLEEMVQKLSMLDDVVRKLSNTNEKTSTKIEDQHEHGKLQNHQQHEQQQQQGRNRPPWEES